MQHLVDYFNNVVKNIVKSVVSSIPANTVYNKPETSVFIKRRELCYPGFGKAKDLPHISKPSFERQIPHKEKKKTKQYGSIVQIS